MTGRVQRTLAVLAALPVVMTAVGCASHVLGPAQIDALHTRQYDAPADITFTATANAMIDMGYHIGLTDADGGVLRAARRRDPSVAEHALWLTLSTTLTLGQAPMLAPPDRFVMCVLVAPDTPGGPDPTDARSVVRFETFKNGRQQGEEERLDELWVRIDRRLLTMGYAAPHLDTPGLEGPDHDAPGVPDR